ncbi:MAG TPA: PSD1 and planctomycete cytochrome C domain-containing protein [Tepidisphaeraceae bacterium]|jgi:hypothetical protein|nr:PSD1 and planctomycete cytochrome C domain-containing protein [Tepidisphaeraceae bacterium]
MTKSPLLIPAIVLSSTAFCGAADISYSRDVRPVLAANCFSCHGQDVDKRKGELRLDDREIATHPAKGGLVAIVAGKPDDSELVKRITAANEDDRMPPAKSGKKPLSSEQIATLKQWIADGAKYESHWAFTPPVRPELPAVKDSAWVRNPIDRFVLARLEKEGLRPSPEADKTTLLRRLSLDLIGLPPTIAEVDAFLADKSPAAYEKQVDRLLASPHYGERWGRHWLDAARYADSDGYEKDKQRFIWFYRDWVINAFNRDLPYDQFIIQQIAGDQLPAASRHEAQDHNVATGFLRNAMLNEEGGVEPEQFRMDEMFDRMDAIGKSILGLTIQCAQCHSHKFDPLTQEEYYRLFAFLNNDNEAFRVVYLPQQQMKVADLSRQMREIEAGLQHQTPDWQEKMAQWEAGVSNDQPAWTVMNLEHTADNDTYFYRQPDGSYLAQGYATTKFTEVFKSKTSMKNISAVRLELLTDPNLPAGGPGRSIKGSCAISEFWVEAALASSPDKKTRLKFSTATSDYDQPVRDLEKMFYDKTDKHRTTGPASYAIDGNDDTAWGIDAGPGRRNQDRKAVFTFDKPTDLDGDVILTFHIKQNHGGWNSDDNQNNNPGRFRISITDAGGKVSADPLPRRVRDILAIPAAQRTALQTAEVFSYWRTTVPEWKEANAKIEGLWSEWPEGVTTQTLVARKDGRQTHILSRGDWLKPTATVAAGVPAFLNQLPPDAPPTRLTLAHWLVDRKSPTTARVFVNRMWQQYFGIGIVATPEDFGNQGELPSHPGLLDWLACEFMEPGNVAPAESGAAASDGASAAPAPWSIKHIQRLIVTSATYRQSSNMDADEIARDPYNRLLAHGPRQRVDGEIVHDIVLAASGLLNDKMGGPPVMPPAPAFLFLPPASYGPFPWIDATGSERYRRAVYTFRRRSTPFPMLATFDVPNGESSCVRRLRTNSPLQALVSLNEPMFVEAAQALARKTLQEGGADDDARIIYAFRRVLSRKPTAAEKKELLALLEKEQKHFADGWANALEVATGKTAAPADFPTDITPTQLAAWTVVSRVLLNLDEAITKE